MTAGLKIWDRDGREIGNIIGRYPKFIGHKIVTATEKQVINYTIPKGTTRIVVPVHLSRNDGIVVPPINNNAPEGYHYTNTYNLWSVNITTTNTGFEYDTTGQDDKQKPPIKIYWGYV